MREILFRGKYVDDDKWIYGHYVHQYGADMIYLPDGTDREYGFDYYHIDPETIGQYTGLTDKNGKKIFEGDIVKYKNTDGAVYKGVKLTVAGKVVYNEKVTGFAIYGKDELGAKHCDYSPIKQIEIIGNIHDNPELLKECEG